MEAAQVKSFEASEGASVPMPAPGEAIAVTGPNGSGKTTALRALLRSDGTAYAPQMLPSGARMRVEDLVMLGRTRRLSAWSRPSSEDAACVVRAMEAMGISHLRRRWTDELSGGELQRAVVAMALAQEAPVLLLDEPASHQDAAGEKAVWKAVADAKARGCGVVVALHGALPEGLFDRIVRLSPM